MNIAKRFALLGVLAIVGATGACNSFLTGGELSTDPNRPTSGTPQARFAAVQGSVWALLSSDPARVTSVWTQQFEGVDIQYGPRSTTTCTTKRTTGGFEAGLYTGGGLVDIREIESRGARVRRLVAARSDGSARRADDGHGSGSLRGPRLLPGASRTPPNPTLDNQLDVYAALQTVLSDADREHGGDGPDELRCGQLRSRVWRQCANQAEQWTQLAHTVKARLFLHTAEVNPAAYASALTEAQLGITDPADDYKAIWSGDLNEQNYWYQFNVVQRAGYIAPGPFLVNLLHDDERSAAAWSTSTPDLSDLSDTRLDPKFSQPLVTAQENLLIWAEAAYRTGATGPALDGAERCSCGRGHGVLGRDGVRPASFRRLLRRVRRCSVRYPDGEVHRRVPEHRSLERLQADVLPELHADGQRGSSSPPACSTISPSVRRTRTFRRRRPQPSRNANDPANATDDFGERL